MSKVSRNQLKSLVKECLFEILLESTEGTPSRALSESRARKVKNTSQRPGLDAISFGPKKNGTKRKKKEPPRIDVSAITSDPVMASIFQDTATTTLVEQRDAERGGTVAGSGDAAARAAAKSDPQSLFGEASSNWAALAFDD